MMLCMEYKGKRLLFFNITEDSPTTLIANRSEFNIVVLDKEVHAYFPFVSQSSPRPNMPFLSKQHKTTNATKNPNICKNDSYQEENIC